MRRTTVTARQDAHAQSRTRTAAACGACGCGVCGHGLRGAGHGHRPQLTEVLSSSLHETATKLCNYESCDVRAY